MSDLATPHHHPRRRRVRLPARIAATVALSCCALGYAAGFLPGHASAVATLIAFIGFMPAYFILKAAVHEAADLPDTHLDEREIAARDRAYLLAYRGIGAVLSLSTLLAIADDALENLTVFWVTPWAAVLLLALVLPSAVLARLQPPPEPA